MEQSNRSRERMNVRAALAAVYILHYIKNSNKETRLTGLNPGLPE